MWERACSRMRWVSQYMCWLNHRIREQARSHGGPVLFLRSLLSDGQRKNSPGVASNCWRKAFMKAEVDS
ncbi:hypothetical protein DCC84_20515 [Pseudomonas sp. SXM-1]|nr:hypothetical protein DCC84_20515 [Pseudomonas sp. SXM-1]